MSFERPGEAGPAPPGWRSHPKSGANSQPNKCPFESLGKGLSGAENRFELSLLFVEKLGFDQFLAIFRHFSTSRCTVEVILTKLEIFFSGFLHEIVIYIQKQAS